MDKAISELEKKISHLTAVVNELRSENQLLNEQLSIKSKENKQLIQKIDAVKKRLNALLKQLPAK